MKILTHRIAYSLILILTYSLISGCNSIVIYAKYGRYQLDQHDINLYPVQQDGIRLFESCCYNHSEKIYLNRVIKNDTKKNFKFISVSETLLQNDLKNLLKTDSTATILDTKTLIVSKQRIDCSLFLKNDFWISRICYIEKKSSLLVIMDFVFTEPKGARNHFVETENFIHEKIRI